MINGEFTMGSKLKKITMASNSMFEKLIQHKCQITSLPVIVDVKLLSIMNSTLPVWNNYYCSFELHLTN